jgi:hypothetical protein
MMKCYNKTILKEEVNFMETYAVYMNSMNEEARYTLIDIIERMGWWYNESPNGWLSVNVPEADGRLYEFIANGLD